MTGTLYGPTATGMKRYNKFSKKRRFKRVQKRGPTSLLNFTNKADFSTTFRLDSVDLANSSLANTYASLAFSLNQVPNFTSWTTLWDHYRIDKIVITFRPALSTVVNRPYDDTTGGSPTQAVPRLAVTVDRDDLNLPTTFNEVEGRPGARVVEATKRLSMSFKPNRLTMVYRTPTTTGYKIDTDWKSFLDCANSDVPHFGLKLALEAASPANAYIYKTSIKYYISFKGRRY